MQADVIIVGAGSAGLSAAKELTKQGISFVVVEASHRIGGRAYSEEIAPDVWFDLGCAYLVAGSDIKNHIDESNPFIDFAKNQGAVIDGRRKRCHLCRGPQHYYQAYCRHQAEDPGSAEAGESVDSNGERMQSG